jgi:hypothetical protein
MTHQAVRINLSNRWETRRFEFAGKSRRRLSALPLALQPFLIACIALPGLQEE